MMLMHQGGFLWGLKFYSFSAILCIGLVASEAFSATRGIYVATTGLFSLLLGHVGDFWE